MAGILGGLPCFPPKETGNVPAKSSAVRLISAGDRRLHIIVLTRYLASPTPHIWHNSSTPEVLISNSVRPAHLNRMEFCILASGEQHRMARTVVRPTGLHIWTTVWCNHARLVNYMLSSKLILRAPREMNREWCDCQLTQNGNILHMERQGNSAPPRIIYAIFSYLRSITFHHFAMHCAQVLCHVLV